MIRTVVERVLAGIIVKRRLPASTGGGALLATSGYGGLKFIFRSREALDPSLLAVARRIVRPGAIVWDIGANVGLFSVAAAGLAAPGGKVFAIEPDLDVARLLMETARLPANRRLAPIAVLPVDVAGSAGVMSLSVAKRARASNSLAGFGNSQMGGIAATRLVPTLSLDDLCRDLPAPTVLKIDVEGPEAILLQGARHLLREHRPIVFCEVGAPNAPAVTAELRQAGYLIFDGADLRKNSRIAEANLAPWDTVAIPEEMARSSGWSL